MQSDKIIRGFIVHLPEARTLEYSNLVVQI